MHLFEVRKNGKTFQYTDNKKSIPKGNILKSICEAGYKVYINGKIWKDAKNTSKKGELK